MTDLKQKTEYFLELADAATPGPWENEGPRTNVNAELNAIFLAVFPDMVAHIRALQAETERLRRDCAEVYQVVGTLAGHSIPLESDDVQRALDNLSAAANGLVRPHDDLLPFPKGDY